MLFKRYLLILTGFVLASQSFGLFAKDLLPASVELAIKKSAIPKEAISISVDRITSHGSDATFNSHNVIHWQESLAMNPASTMKLVTSLAAMEMLGPQYRWKTDLFTNGHISKGTLRGDLLIRGSGDPKLIPEELNKLLTNLKVSGVKNIHGDLIFDRSAYDKSVKESSLSDDEPTRSYNVAPDALLFAFNSFSFEFYPNLENRLVVIKQTPRLANLSINNNLIVVDGSCTNWRDGIKMSFKTEKNSGWVVSFNGHYPSSCSTANWNVVTSDSDQFLSQGLIAAWEDIGGTWGKKPVIKSGQLTESFRPIVTHFGIPLYESVKDINKLSNNVMARQVLLTLAIEKNSGPGNTNNGNMVVKSWLKKYQLDMPELVIENGSGLSRIERISSKNLNQVLLLGLNSSTRDYFTESLPIAGVDGTMKHRLMDKLRQYNPRKSDAQVFENNLSRFPKPIKKYGAYIKTGSLADVRSISGYVVSKTGQVYTISSFINHQNAHAGRGIHDALMTWLLDDGPQQLHARAR
uniref:D-alanyl-D-alanine carboxypeptidase/D-alanyl-D-alanine endopeptidase n=1 Tax=Polynucleobacter sp. TaxID=2029855 RepID=UPI0040478CF5